MKTNRKAKDNNRSTGRSRKEFPFEDEMDDFIGEKASKKNRGPHWFTYSVAKKISRK